MTRSIAAALVSMILATVARDAKAEVTARQAGKQLPTAIKQARVETSGATTFIINGRRVLVPADANAEAVIKALKARYPSLQADTGAARTVRTIEEK